MFPFDEIPDDLVPLTAYFKYLLTLATSEQPILLFLDSVDQLTGVQGNKLSWLPTRLPSNCKVRYRSRTNRNSIDSIEEFLDDFVLCRRGIESRDLSRLSAIKEDDRHRGKLHRSGCSRRRSCHGSDKVATSVLEVFLQRFKEYSPLQDVDENSS